LTSTTITEAVTSASASQITVASATDFAVGRLAYIDREAMSVTAVSGTRISVVRGANGTRATAHPDNAQVYVGPPNYFATVDKDQWSSCTRTDNLVLPIVNVRSGKAWQCYGSRWMEVSREFQGTAAKYPVGAAVASAMPDAVYFDEDFINVVAATDALPNWSTTLVEAGGGDSTVTIVDGSAGELLLTTDANENDGINFQKTIENFSLGTGQSLTYFGIRLKSSEATQSDFLVGLCITDTTLLGGMTDGVYFEKLDGGTGVSFATEKDSTETQTDSLHTFAADTYVTLELIYNGANVEAYIDGVYKATHSTNLPDNELLTPSIHFLTGDAAAETLTVDRVRAVQIGR
jgi:hypothetical protein